MRSLVSRVAALIVTGLLVGACTAAASSAPVTTPTPTSSPASPSRYTTPSSPPSATASATPSATPDDAAPPTWTADEDYLLNGLRADARFGCAARRVDLPAHAVAGVECSPEVDFVDRIGVYLFTSQDELLETYFARLADYGVEPRSGWCGQGAGEDAYVPGDSGATIGPYRLGCYLNEFGNANYRFTVPDSLVYVGILGTGNDVAALHDWAWLGNLDTPGGPTVWLGQAR